MVFVHVSRHFFFFFFLADDPGAPRRSAGSFVGSHAAVAFRLAAEPLNDAAARPPPSLSLSLSLSSPPRAAAADAPGRPPPPLASPPRGFARHDALPAPRRRRVLVLVLLVRATPRLRDGLPEFLLHAPHQLHRPAVRQEFRPETQALLSRRSIPIHILRAVPRVPVQVAPLLPSQPFTTSNATPFAYTSTSSPSPPPASAAVPIVLARANVNGDGRRRSKTSRWLVL